MDHGNTCEPLWCIVVHYSPLWKRFRSLADYWNASKPLQFTMMHCGASTTHCGGVHHTWNSLTIMAVHYGNVTESLRTTGMLADHCGALRWTTVHYGALWKRCESLADHWNASKSLRFTTTHCDASSARSGGMYHTLTEMPTFHPPAYIPANP